MAGISLKAKGILTRITYLYRRKFFQIKPPFLESKKYRPKCPAFSCIFAWKRGYLDVMKLMKWRSQLSEDEIAENKKCKITLNTLLDVFTLKSCWEIGKKSLRIVTHLSGAPKDCFVLNTLKTLFRLSIEYSLDL